MTTNTISTFNGSKHKSKVKAHAAEVESAEKIETDRATELDQAVEHLDQIKSRLGSGDATVTTDDYTRASSAVERARVLKAGAENTVKALRARAPFEPEIATAVAQTLSERFEVPAHVVESMPTEQPAQVPVMLVMQDRAATAARWPAPAGSLSGQVKAVFIRPPYMNQGLSQGAVESALSEPQGEFMVSRISTNGSRDSFTVSAAWVYAEQPRFTIEPSELTLKHLGEAVAATMKEPSNTGRSAPVASSSGSGYAFATVYGLGTKSLGAGIVGTSTKTGVRTLTIDCDFDMWVSRGFQDDYSPTWMNDHAERTAQRYVGKVLDSLGRVRSVKVSHPTVRVGEILRGNGMGTAKREDRGALPIYRFTFTVESAV